MPKTTVVLGAGVIGVTTAYYLAMTGRKVIVIDRQDGVAMETSFANAGLIAPGHAYTWSSPRAPKILAKSLFLPGQALRLKPSLDPRMWSWCWQFLLNCTEKKSALNTRRKVRLCSYSQAKLQELARKEGLDYRETRKGLLYVYRKRETLERGARNSEILRSEGLPIRILDRAAVVQLEPTFGPSQARIAGALYCESDESGDSHVFASALAARCKALGVEFRLGTQIEHIDVAGDRIAQIATDHGTVRGDEYVLALGSFSPALVRHLRFRLPIYPVKGYSLTLPIGQRHAAPLIGGVDEDRLTAWARFGDRFRLTATAEFSGFSVAHRPSDFTGMLATARELFPEAADYSSPSYWACLRPMTPEGTPILGATPHRNLFLNVGHGHMGWTMACGSAQMVVDMMDGKATEIPVDGMTLQQG